MTLLDRAGVPVHRIMQVSGHRNEGSVKVYCERQTLQQQKQCSEILAAPVASTALATKPTQQIEHSNINEITYQKLLQARPNLSTLGMQNLKTVLLRSRQYNVTKKSD